LIFYYIFGILLVVTSDSYRLAVRPIDSFYLIIKRPLGVFLFTKRIDKTFYL